MSVHNHDSDIHPAYINLQSNNYTTKNGSSSYVFELNRTIYSRSNVDMLLSVDSFKFTNSFYNIDSFNNILYYRTDGDSYISLYTITFPHGNYGINALILYLNNSPFTFVFNETTFKITCTHDTDDFYFIDGDNNMNEVLGFDNLISSSGSLTGDNLINLIGVQMLYVISPTFSLRTVLDKNDNKSNNILLSTPISSHPGDVQVYDGGNHFHKIANNNINTIELVIVDQNNRQVDFNGISFYLNISINFSYRKSMILPQFLLDEVKEDTDDKNKK